MGIIYLVATTVIYCLVHSLTASNPAKSLVRRWFGSQADRWYRLGFNIFSGITFLPILWLLAVLPDQTLYTVEMPWLVLTFTGQIAGAAIIVIGILQTGALSFMGLGQLLSPADAERKAVFVDHGLYRWVRHPLYTGGLIIIWLAPVMTVNLLVLFSLLTIYLVIGAKLEERRLVAEFGGTYQEYCKVVPMLIPRLGKKGN